MAKVVRQDETPNDELRKLKSGETLVWLVTDHGKVVDVFVFKSERYTDGTWLPVARNSVPLKHYG